MTPQRSKTSHETEIRALIDDWAKAFRGKDVKGVTSHYAADMVSYDLAPPLEFKGADTIRTNLEKWFPTFRAGIGFEMRDLNVTADGDVAFSHSLNRIRGTRSNGEETDVWVRATICYRKIDGKWKVTHEHISVPFYMDGSYKAAVDLKPGSSLSG